MTEKIGTALIPVNPIGWKAPTAYAKRAGGKVFAGMSPNAEVAAFQNAMREWLDENWTEPAVAFPVRVDWRFKRQQPSYINDKGRRVTKHAQDATNMLKSAEDALQPRVLFNDVWVRHITVVVVDQGPHVEDPFVEFTVSRL